VRFGLIAMGMIVLLMAAAPVGATTRHAPGAEIKIEQTRSGPVLADGSGRTLYVYVEDLLTREPSACVGDCANDWPPALVSGKVAPVRGVAGHIGTIRRRDGLHQLTLDGRPLYTFAGDHSSGELRGNGVGNIWWAMTPSGLSATSFPIPKLTYGAPASTVVTVVQSKFGPAVANDRGQVLYAYTDDTPTHSACNSPWCLVDWPPLAGSGTPTAPPAVTAPLTVIAGAGGTQQVALAGHPLYVFAGDLHTGDTRGQGIGGDWLMVSPTGSLIHSGTAVAAPGRGKGNRATQ